MTDALAALEAQVRDDLHKIAHPTMPWLTPKTGPDGKPALDVLIVGAGQGGVTAGFGLLRSQVTNILVVDKSAEDYEGPWRTYARMPTLRSPKHFTGPDLDIPALTYQSWHEAMFGKDHWQALDRIPRGHWADYLLWFRRMTGVPVRNGCEVLDIAPAANGLLAATVQSASGIEVIHTRKVLLATGQEGMGDWMIPEQLRHLPSSLCVNGSADIDFAALRGKTVVVVGAGASAFDNAATALEAGADVQLLCRRAEIQIVQPYHWLTFRGFLRHFSELDDAWRWRFMLRLMSLREGFPQPTWDRCARHAGFHLRENASIQSAQIIGNQVALQTSQGTITADFVICGTGIDMNFAGRRELQSCAGNIASWADRYDPPTDEREERLGRFPYLSDDYALTERVPGATPWISNIHLFAIASTLSFGPSGSSINAMTTAIPKLVHGLTRGLFCDDIATYWASFQAYDVPQVILSKPPEAVAKS